MKSSVLKKFCEYEKKGGSSPLLPYQYRWVGLGICLIAIVGLLFISMQEIEPSSFYKDLSMHTVLIGLFLLVISRDKNEDERTKQLRYRAFAFSFVLGTVMLLILPFIVILKNSIIGKALEWEFQSFFFIMSSYLFYYLMYFQIFKRQL